ncbi:hypothetical protein XPA_000177 [Xanthoria parietina]
MKGRRVAESRDIAPESATLAAEGIYPKPPQPPSYSLLQNSRRKTPTPPIYYHPPYPPNQNIHQDLSLRTQQLRITRNGIRSRNTKRGTAAAGGRKASGRWSRW